VNGAVSSRELVWVVNEAGRLELGRPDEQFHIDLLTRLGWSAGDLIASGVIKDGRAVQCAPGNGHEWEEEAQALYDREYAR
jgi:hypothetical protein